MPSDLIRSIFPKRLRHRDGEEAAATSPAVSQASEKVASCTLQEPPPPYASENHAPNDEKELPVDTSSSRPTIDQVSTQTDLEMSSDGSIQVCPHAVSSFERIQRIVKLRNFKESYDGLDALTPGPDHRNLFSSGFRLCKPDSGSDLNIQGWGQYLYDRYGTAYPRKDTNFSTKEEGLVLKFFWTLNFVNVLRKQRQSKEDIERLLSQTKVELCAHYQLSHPMVVAAIHRLLCPEDDVIDPIDMWEAGYSNGTTTIACGECATVVKIHGVKTYLEVDTERYLGRGETCTDPKWLTQCGAREGTTKVIEKLN